MGAAAGRTLHRLGVDPSALDVRCRIGQFALENMGLRPLDAASAPQGMLAPMSGEARSSALERGGGLLREARHCEDVGAAPKRRRVDPLGSDEPPSPHVLRVVGPIAYCEACGSYAIERHGIAMQEACRGPVPNAKARIERMRRGLHPLTGASLVSQ